MNLLFHYKSHTFKDKMNKKKFKNHSCKINNECKFVNKCIQEKINVSKSITDHSREIKEYLLDCCPIKSKTIIKM